MHSICLFYICHDSSSLFGIANGDIYAPLVCKYELFNLTFIIVLYSLQFSRSKIFSTVLYFLKYMNVYQNESRQVSPMHAFV